MEPWDQGLGESLEEIIDSEIIKPREKIPMEKKDHNGKKDFSESHNFENPESSKILHRKSLSNFQENSTLEKI